MSDQFMIPPRKREFTDNPRGAVIRVSTDAYNALIEMTNESTLSISMIASRAVLFAQDHLSYREEEN